MVNLVKKNNFTKLFLQPEICSYKVYTKDMVAGVHVNDIRIAKFKKINFCNIVSSEVHIALHH